MIGHLRLITSYIFINVKWSPLIGRKDKHKVWSYYLSLIYQSRLFFFWILFAHFYITNTEKLNENSFVYLRYFYSCILRKVTSTSFLSLKIRRYILKHFVGFFCHSCFNSILIYYLEDILINLLFFYNKQNSVTKLI